MRPSDLKYSETHEWIRVEGDIAVIGITDYAVKELSDLVYMELPEVGEAVEVDVRFGEIESVKTVSELISPLSGTVVEINAVVAEDLDILAKDPYEDGWLLKVRMSDKSELGSLMSATEYDEMLVAEEDDDDDDSMDDMLEDDE